MHSLAKVTELNYESILQTISFQRKKKKKVHTLRLPFDNSLQKSQNKPSIFHGKENAERGDKSLKKYH